MAKTEMQKLFEDGGLTDDGSEVDAVSGNDVPSGSMAEEVRDDIPAKLSSGEYVVPADVVRYFGVKFFEDLRSQAKSGLGEMEADGRIGGEPVEQEDAEGALTPEEMAALHETMGMAVGGYVPMQPPPQALGNTAQDTKGYAEGGTVETPATPTSNFNPMQYPLGFSLFKSSGSTAPATTGTTGTDTTQTTTDTTGTTTDTAPSDEAVTTSTVTLYGPGGVVRTLVLPADQEEYDRLISEGWTKYQPSDISQGDQTSEAMQPAGQEEDVVSYKDIDKALKDVNYDDPIGAAREALEGKSKGMSIAGAIVGAIFGGPTGAKVGQALGGKVGEVSNLAEAAANAEIAKILGYDTTSIDKSINDKVESLGLISSSSAIKAIDTSRKNARLAITDVNSPFALTRDKFQSDAAFEAGMQSVAPAGMTYQSDTGSYQRAGSAAPVTSPKPVAKPIVSKPTTTVTSDNNDRNSQWDGGQVGVSQETAQKSSDVQSGRSQAAGATTSSQQMDTAGYSGQGYTRGRATGGLVQRKTTKKPKKK